MIPRDPLFLNLLKRMRMNVVLCILVSGIALAAVRDTHGKTCWEGPWFNNSSPSLHNGTDTEIQTAAELQSICSDGGPVVDAHCKDEKGEPFRGFKNDTANHYVATCTIMTGLQCKPYSYGHCADFAIQYGCNCPTTPATTGSRAGGSGSVEVTTSKVRLTTGFGRSISGEATLGTGLGTGSTESGLNGGGTSKVGFFGSSGASESSSGSSGNGASKSGISSGPNNWTTVHPAGIGSSSSGNGSVVGGTIGGSSGSSSGGAQTGNGSGGTQTGSGSVGNGQGQSLGSNGCTCRNGCDKYRPGMLLFLLFPN